MARCCASRDAHFMPVSRKLLRASLLKLPRTNLSYLRVTTPKLV